MIDCLPVCKVRMSCRLNATITEKQNQNYDNSNNESDNPCEFLNQDAL